MDELIVYIHTLLKGDRTIQTLFIQNQGLTPVNPPTVPGPGQALTQPSAVSCVAPEQRNIAAYPRLVIEGDEDDQVSTGDVLPKFFDGLFRAEAITQLDAVKCPDHLGALYAIKNRVRDLLLGVPASGNNGVPLAGLDGVRVGTNWQCTKILQVKPTRRIPAEEPTVARHLSTFEVQLSRHTI